MVCRSLVVLNICFRKPVLQSVRAKWWCFTVYCIWYFAMTDYLGATTCTSIYLFVTALYIICLCDRGRAGDKDSEEERHIWGKGFVGGSSLCSEHPTERPQEDKALCGPDHEGERKCRQYVSVEGRQFCISKMTFLWIIKLFNKKKMLLYTGYFHPVFFNPSTLANGFAHIEFAQTQLCDRYSF